MIKNRCSPVSLVLFIAIGAFLICAVSAQAASGPSASAAAGSNAVTASVRSVQPAISGLFQVHTARVWTPGANGVPDFLDSWQAFRAREDAAILKNAYAFRTIDGQGDQILYAGVQRTSSGGPSKVVFEFNQKPGERLIGDLRIDAEIDAEGNVGTARFESYSGKENGKFLTLALLSGEGCNDAGTACIVANGALLEIGVNLSQLQGEAKNRFSGIQITTPEDSVVGRFSQTGVIAGCVGDVGNLNNPSCTANDVRLTSVDPASLVIIGPGCDNVPDHCIGGSNDGGACTTDAQCPSGSCKDTVEFSATGNFLSGSAQRYDIGLYIATDGDAVPPGKSAGDGAKFGLCERFAFTNTETGVNLDGDGCGDLQLSATTSLSFGPVRIACVDTNGDGKVDIFHCETWGNAADEVGHPVSPSKNACTNSTDVEAGTGSKCFCGILSSFCIAFPDTNPCTDDICARVCSNAGTTICASDADCPTGGTCLAENAVHIPVPGRACGDPGSGVCDNPDTCDASGVCQPNHLPATTTCRASAGPCDVAESCDGNGNCPADTFKPSTTICRASTGQCDIAESCTGTSAACPADGFQPSTTPCVGTSNGGACDGTDSCDGANHCVDGFLPSTTICRPAVSACDVAESCTGSSGACPPDVNPPCGGLIAPTATTCTDFLNGTAGDLDEILYGVKNKKINNVAPGVLFYYTHITAPAANFTIFIDQSNSDSDVPLFTVHNGQVSFFNPNCTSSSLATPTLIDGDVTIQVTGATPGLVYILGIKYDPGSVVGTSTSVFTPPVHYDWKTLVNGNQVEADPDGLDLNPK